MTSRVVAVLGTGVVPPDSAVVRADDLGILRGDGIFETLHLRDGSPWLLDAHLDRLARSAARIDLDLPPRHALVELIAQSVAAWPAEAEGELRLVATRGSEDGGPVTVFTTIGPVGDRTRAARRDGVRVVTASLGWSIDTRASAPWLLGGVKSISYAVNMASRRWAAARGYDDMLWLSTEGYALEGATSTLVWLVGRRLLTVPASTGILPGTTAGYLFDHADKLGHTCDEQLVTPAELAEADGVWLLNAVRGVVAVRAIDAAELPAVPETRLIQELLGFLP